MSENSLQFTVSPQPDLTLFLVFVGRVHTLSSCSKQLTALCMVPSGSVRKLQMFFHIHLFHDSLFS